MVWCGGEFVAHGETTNHPTEGHGTDTAWLRGKLHGPMSTGRVDILKWILRVSAQI